MSIYWGLRRALGRWAYAVLERLPEGWRRKAAIVCGLMKNDWRLARFLGLSSAELRGVGEEDVERHFQGLDVESIALVKRFVGKTQFVPWMGWVTSVPPRHSYLWAGLCSNEEYWRGVRQAEEELPALRNEYHLPATLGEASSLIYHHGLCWLPSPLNGYLNGKVVIDAGAYAGESALALLRHGPAQVHSFEPSPANRELFVKTMAANQIQPNRVVLVDKGLSAREGKASFCESTAGTALRGRGGACTVDLVPLDKYVRDERIDCVGMIKADVEGMGLDLLKGALETIRRDRPILSLCIYHNREELLGTYELLRQQNLPYKFQIKSLCLPWENTELVLLAFPA